jgi:hypothetical protein
MVRIMTTNTENAGANPYNTTAEVANAVIVGLAHFR